MRALVVALVLGGCASSVTSSSDPRDAAVDEAAAVDVAQAAVDVTEAAVDVTEATVDVTEAADAAVDVAPDVAPPRCDLTGTWEGTGGDVSRTPPGSIGMTLQIVQTGFSLTGLDRGLTLVGTVRGDAVSMRGGAMDYTLRIYEGTVSAACDAITGMWAAWEMSHGPLTLRRR